MEEEFQRGYILCETYAIRYLHIYVIPGSLRPYLFRVKITELPSSRRGLCRQHGISEFFLLRACKKSMQISAKTIKMSKFR